jgi:hypothetical protein
MRPQWFAPKSYDAAKLAVLQDVFDKAWKILELRFPARSEEEEERIKTVLAKTIEELSNEGVFDAQDLFRQSLKGVLATHNRALAKRKPRTRLVVS